MPRATLPARGDLAVQARQAFANASHGPAVGGARPEQVTNSTIFVAGYPREYLPAIEQGPPGHGEGHIVAWTWKLVTAPESSSLSSRGRAWELARHRAYQKHLAGHSIAETFGRAAPFPTLTAANVPSITKMSAYADR